MPKKISAANRPVKKQHETDLRKWCVEQAIRWPYEYVPGHIPSTIKAPNHEERALDVDLIGRATKILNWVKGS